MIAAGLNLRRAVSLAYLAGPGVGAPGSPDQFEPGLRAGRGRQLQVGSARPGTSWRRRGAPQAACGALHARQAAGSCPGCLKRPPAASAGLRLSFSRPAGRNYPSPGPRPPWGFAAAAAAPAASAPPGSPYPQVINSSRLTTTCPYLSQLLVYIARIKTERLAYQNGTP